MGRQHTSPLSATRSSWRPLYLRKERKQHVMQSLLSAGGGVEEELCAIGAHSYSGGRVTVQCETVAPMQSYTTTEISVARRGFQSNARSLIARFTQVDDRPP